MIDEYFIENYKQLNCHHVDDGNCCFRKNRKCTLLADDRFPDNVCHFRKDYLDGPNLYDVYCGRLIVDANGKVRRVKGHTGKVV